MKHQEVKNLQQALTALINHCIEKKVDIFHVNYGLDKNHTGLSAAVEAIDKNVSKELIELEKKSLELGKGNDQTLEVGLSLLTKKERTRHAELMAEYNLAMQEENDLELFMLDPAKIESIKIEYPYYLILKNFLPKEIEPPVKSATEKQ